MILRTDLSAKVILLALVATPLILGQLCAPSPSVSTYTGGSSGYPDPCSGDRDDDGTPDCNDNCPDDPNKTEPGSCGCSTADTDSDNDGTADCKDDCPNDPNKTKPGYCDCGTPDTNSDYDDTPDCDDNCPNNSYKTEPGVCGCGTTDMDNDLDGTPDCNDNCPNDPNKTEPGVCGCWTPDTDSDSDGTLDCNDNCPNDPNKTEPGVCGCWTPDTDSDSDGTRDCHDNCPNDPMKTEPGECGCGVADPCTPSITILDKRTRIPYVVSFDMRLKDAAGHAIAEGVDREKFHIHEDGALLDYTETNQFVTPGENLPLKIVVVLDYTNSMSQAGAIGEMIAAAKVFINADHFTGSHYIGVVEFHDRDGQGEGFDEVVPLTRADEEGKQVILEGIPDENNLEHGLTRVWDAVDLGITMISNTPAEQGEARAIVFLTDGRDTTSTTSAQSVSGRAAAWNIALYPIGFGDVAENEDTLQSLADRTEGTYYPAASADALQNIFAQIILDLRGQWNLTYITQKNTGNVNVRVKFDWEGGTAFEYNFDAGAIAGDIHQGVIEVLDRTCDPDTDQTTFLLKAAYIPRSISKFLFVFPQQGAKLALQESGGLLKDWQNPTSLGNGRFKVEGFELEYGAFGNIGTVSVSGDMQKLAASHDNSVYGDLPQAKTIVFEGPFWGGPN